MKILKDVYKREEASPSFKAKLRNRLAVEAGAATGATGRPFWRRTSIIWIPTVAGAAVALILVVALVIVPAIFPHKASLVGALEVRVTDAKNEPVVTAINVTFGSITVHKSGGAGDVEGEWITVAENLGKTVDLLQLSGVGELLGEDEIEAGNYTQIRVGVVRVEVNVDGVNQEVALEPAGDAEMPSGELKFVRPFEVEADETTVITIDFDISADNSVVFAGGKLIFKPTIKLNIASAAE